MIKIFQKLFGNSVANKDKINLKIKRCGVCGKHSSKLILTVDKKNNTGYFCKKCNPHWSEYLKPNSSFNFFLCSKCGFKIFAAGKVDKSGTCSECGENLDNTYTNLDQNKSIGNGFMT